MALDKYVNRLQQLREEGKVIPIKIGTNSKTGKSIISDFSITDFIAVVHFQEGKKTKSDGKVRLINEENMSVELGVRTVVDFIDKPKLNPKTHNFITLTKK